MGALLEIISVMLFIEENAEIAFTNRKFRANNREKAPQMLHNAYIS